MNTHKHRQQLVQTDAYLADIHLPRPAPKAKDPNHAQRRQQQRGINPAMIRIALGYGRKHHRHGAIVFTLSDKTLRYSPYAKFTDTLRGLTVVCSSDITSPQLLTTYWNFACKRYAQQ